MKKRTLMIISVAAVLVLAVGGILAYLTDTAQVTNTFTVGNVDITVTEAKVDENGKLVLDDEGNPVDRVTDGKDAEGKVIPANTYHLIPGMTYIKDPTMTVKAGSEESYVRMIVTITHASQINAIFDDYEGNVITQIFKGYDPATWVCVNPAGTVDTATNTIKYEFRYYDNTNKKATVKPAKDADLPLDALFDAMEIPGKMTKEDLAKISEMKIIVEGHAIQAAGFEDTKDDAGNVTLAIDNAWAAFEAEVK
ncbi:MAG: SipW-dependent-type signal peptide-containing protein [Firmicutes bacterium]|nr:SipW-dependent-type signal peptide-containing protein [Bacillota bacterium]MBR6799346.1 SipW-dependent-type signal peptide-containing protein [Bacillota bacterium]